MTNSDNENDVHIHSISISANLRDSTVSGERVMRTVCLGMAPLVLIEPDFEIIDGDDEGAVGFLIDATDFGDKESLAELLEMIVSALRDGTEQ